MTALALAFHDTQFEVVSRCGQPWLQARQIGQALGYAREDAINKIYERNKEEFSDSMTCTVKLTLQGQSREVRIFSLRGCHLLAMFARTKVAKEFRKWVLDVLDKHVAETQQSAANVNPGRKTKALPNGLTKDQQDAVKALVKSRVEVLPPEKRAGAAVRCWSSIKSKFGTTYKEVPAELFTDVVSLIARLPLEGEYLPAEGEDAIIIDLDASSAQHDVRILGDAITLDVIHEGYIGGNPVSRLFSLLNMAATQNRPVKVKSVVGAQAIWMAAQEIAWKTRFALRDLERAAESARNSGVKLSMIIPNK